MNEIVDNVNLHANHAPGVVCAQLFPTKRKLDIAILIGIGIGALFPKFRSKR